MTPIDLYEPGFQRGYQRAPSGPPPIVPPTDIPDLAVWFDSDASRVTHVAGAVSALDERFAVAPMLPLTGPVGSQPFWSATAGSLVAPGIAYNLGALTVRLVSADAVLAGLLSSPANRPYTLVVIAEATAFPAATAPRFFGMNATATADSYARGGFSTSAANSLSFSRRGSGSSVSNSNWLSLTLTLNTPFFAAMRFVTGANQFTARLGTANEATTTLTAASAVCNQFTLGNGNTGGGAAFAQPFSGIIYEELFYTRALTDDELDDLHAYFRSVYPTLP